ncbi:MAG: polymerase sigma-70 factor, subfamily [Desulfovibrionales bacterium]|jgi:RNA polymerase sigma-70 factor (ECF subfamily)|nr:polymerase sigma-70 factor, subfamily [Desulfovibrionales bacterium]
MRQRSSRTDADLVELCKSGETEAFEELVRRRKREILGFISKFCDTPDEVDDLGQEVFLKAYQGLSGFRASSSFRTWLYRITSNVCLDHLRRKRREPITFVEDVTLWEQGEDSNVQEQRVLVESLLNALSPMDRMIVTMLHIEGFSVQQTAERLGVTGVSVRVRAHRARKRLKSLMEERHDQ